MPQRDQMLLIVQDCESALEKSQPLAGLPGRHSQPILARRRRSSLASGNGPELIEILGNNGDPFLAEEQQLNHVASHGTVRMGRVGDPRKHIRVQEDHSPSIRMQIASR
jgi:hypothetical protein